MKKLTSYKHMDFKYIYNKPECILIRRFFYVIICSFLLGALLQYFDFQSLMEDNKYIQYENNSMAINIIGGFLITEGCYYLKTSVLWLYKDVYSSRAITYDVSDALFQQNMGGCKLHQDLLEKLVHVCQGTKVEENAFYFIAADHGIGKTTFLKQLYEKLDADKAMFYGGDYCDEISSQLDNWLENHEVLIFDSFEDIFIRNNHLLLKEILNCSFTKVKGKKIIIAFSGNYLSDVEQLLYNLPGTKDILIFNYSKADIDLIQAEVASSLNINPLEFAKNSVYTQNNYKAIISYSVIEDLRKGISIPVVEIVTLLKVLLADTFQRISHWVQISQKYLFNPREFFVLKYLLNIVEQAAEPVVCLIVLYSLAKCSKLRQALTYNDMQNILFVDNNLLQNIVLYLKEVGLIEISHNTLIPESRLKLNSHYWIDKIISASMISLESNVMYSLDCYFTLRNQSETYVSNDFESFKVSTDFCKKFLCGFIGVLGIINLYLFTKCETYTDYLYFGWLNILAFLNVLYNYNYVYHFLLPCDRKLVWNLILSSIMQGCMLYFYDYWYYAWGIGILFQIICLAILGTDIFKKDITVFSMIGLLVSGLGGAVYYICNNYLMSTYADIVPFIKIGGMSIVIAVMLGSHARHIILTYLVGNIMKYKLKRLIIR